MTGDINVHVGPGTVVKTFLHRRPSNSMSLDTREGALGRCGAGLRRALRRGHYYIRSNNKSATWTSWKSENKVGMCWRRNIFTGCETCRMSVETWRTDKTRKKWTWMLNRSTAVSSFSLRSRKRVLDTGGSTYEPSRTQPSRVEPCFWLTIRSDRI